LAEHRRQHPRASVSRAVGVPVSSSQCFPGPQSPSGSPFPPSAPPPPVIHPFAPRSSRPRGPQRRSPAPRTIGISNQRRCQFCRQR
jgi:hypothetical protein